MLFSVRMRRLRLPRCLSPPHPVRLRRHFLHPGQILFCPAFVRDSPTYFPTPHLTHELSHFRCFFSIHQLIPVICFSELLLPRPFAAGPHFPPFFRYNSCQNVCSTSPAWPISLCRQPLLQPLCPKEAKLNGNPHTSSALSFPPFLAPRLASICLPSCLAPGTPRVFRSRVRRRVHGLRRE